MQKSCLLLFILTAISFFACSDSSSTEPDTIITPTENLDEITKKLQNPSKIILVNISEDSPKLKANFNKDLYGSNVNEYRLYLLKQSEPIIDSSLLSNQNYFKYLPNTDPTTVEININDRNGESLKPFAQYVAYIIAVKSDGSSLLTNNLSNTSTIAYKNNINGYWKGKGATNIFPDVNVVLELELVDNTIRGKSYYTTSVPPVGPYHGYKAQISGNELVNIVLDKYPSCFGTFEGTGSFVEETTILSNTPGTDCDGTHNFFTINVQKQ